MNTKKPVSYEATIRRLRRAMAKENCKLTIERGAIPKYYEIELETGTANKTSFETLLDHYKIIKEWEKLDV